MDIKENQKNHSNAMSYEFFLNLAFKCDKRLNRPNKSELINLIKTKIVMDQHFYRILKNN